MASCSAVTLGSTYDSVPPKTPRSLLDAAKMRPVTKVVRLPNERTPQDLKKMEHLWKMNMSLCWEKTIDKNLRRQPILDSHMGLEVELESGTLNKRAICRPDAMN